MSDASALAAAAQPHGQSSPFDAIRRTRPDGSEYWSARELMPLLGYGKWQDFDSAVNRAKISCEAAGNAVTSNFTDARKNSIDGIGRPGLDYELSRFGCYLVAMNGDPRMPKIADAQTYFAVRARQDEVREQMTERDRALMLARQLIAESDRADRAELEVARVEELRAIDAPKVEAHDEFLASDGRSTLEALGKMRGMPGPKLVVGWLLRNGYLRYDNMLPHQKWINQKLFVVTPTGVVEVTAKGKIRLLAERAQEKG